MQSMKLFIIGRINIIMTKRKIRFIIFDIVLAIILVALDQLTKYLAVVHLKDKMAIPLIKDVFELKYLENRGAAFGIMQNQTYFFIFISIVVIVVLSYLIYKLPEHKKYNILHITFVLILSGAIGNNLFDRVQLNYVVDFLYFKLIDFPIFNVADTYVSCATVLLCILLLFYYKDNDLEFLSFKEKKIREIKN